MSKFSTARAHGKHYDVTVTEGRHGAKVIKVNLFAKNPAEAKREAIAKAVAEKGESDNYAAQVRRAS
jgi:hypothetical protein